MGKTPIQRGAIVDVFLMPPDNTQGEAGKVRPAVVVVVGVSDETCEVVGISTKLDQGDKDYFIEMPFANSGNRANSGLTEKCVAKAFWHDEVKMEDCAPRGFIPSVKLFEVLEKLEQFRASQK